jgi:hypothetical protein
LGVDSAASGPAAAVWWYEAASAGAGVLSSDRTLLVLPFMLNMVLRLVGVGTATNGDAEAPGVRSM